MSETILYLAAAFSLLLTVAYWIARKRQKLEAELRSARRIESLAGLRISNSYSLEEFLKEILITLTRAYASRGGILEFHGRRFGDFSIKIGEKERSEFSSLEKKHGKSTAVGDHPTEPRKYGETREGHVAFVIDDDTFLCRVDLEGGVMPAHSEYWYIQELMREKISWIMNEKLNQTAKTALKEVGIPYAALDGNGKLLFSNNDAAEALQSIDEAELRKAIGELSGTRTEQILFTAEKSKKKVLIRRVDKELFAAFFPPDASDNSAGRQGAIESLLFQALDDFSMGVVVLNRDDRRKDSQYSITNINRAFYRIFGLDGSNAQSDEVEEILSAALGPEETKKFSVGGSHSTTDFSYMRRDGLRVRARLTVVKGPDDSRLIVFEPVENTHLLMSSYQKLINAAHHLFATGDVRLYLKEIRDATHSDGIALARRTADMKGFELAEKVGFIINVPQLLLEDLPSRDLINSQGYLVVPLKGRDTVTDALIALKPNEEAIEIFIVGAKVLEAHNILQRENYELHLQNARSLAEAKRADEATRSKSEFLASMSHEIRTPLNSIIGFADIIHSESNDLAAGLLSEFSGNIVTAGKHLLSLINDILDLTKVETGKMKLDLQEFSLNEVVESIRRILKPLLDRGHVSLETRIEDGLDVFVADTVKFKQILYNLLNNAITYSPQGSTVKLDIARSADGIEMKVIDTGAGIKKEDMDKLFRPFAQLNKKNGGSGLGLLLTKRLVELHGGVVWMDSEYGKGTTVVSYLPNCPDGALDRRQQEAVPDDEGQVLFLTTDDHLYELMATVVDGMGFTLTKVDPQSVGEVAASTNENTVWVIDASPENLNGDILSAFKDASKVLLLTEPEEIRSISDLLSTGPFGIEYESRVSFIDRRNFTKSELLAELSTAGH